MLVDLLRDTVLMISSEQGRIQSVATVAFATVKIVKIEVAPKDKFRPPILLCPSVRR